ncbi:MAG: TatD family hydrolase [Candidatus Pacearchaeota archaeon]|nr:TatD family hydrolase [Candidatus Pacearchaeota archaeon]
MIDCHCHLEQKEYDKEREELIKEWKQELRAIVTCCAHPRDFALTLGLCKKYPTFVFCSVGIHPEYVKEVNDDEIDKTLEKIENHKDKITAIGETGLDYYWIKEPEWQEKQRDLFRKLIAIAKKLGKPMVIHSRDATDDTINILEEEGMKNKKVLMHLFNDKKVLARVIDNGWFISIGPSIKKSKDIRKIARDTPLNKILLETDSPWFAQKEQGQEYGTPLNVKIACEKIAEIRKLEPEEVEKQTDLNAIEFFDLKLK